MQSPDQARNNDSELGCADNSTLVLVGNVSFDTESVRTCVVVVPTDTFPSPILFTFNDFVAELSGEALPRVGN